MSIKSQPTKCSKLILMRNIFLGLTFIVVASINDNPQKNVQYRQPSSINAINTSHSSHGVSANFLKHPLMKHTRKLSVPMMTHIKGPKNSLSKGETAIITGHLKVTSDIKNVKVAWILPEGIELTSGSPSSFLSSTETGQSYQFQITVKSNVESNEIIHLVAKTDEGSNYYSNSAQFHTVQQNDLKQANTDLYERSKQYMQEQAYLEE